MEWYDDPIDFHATPDVDQMVDLFVDNGYDALMESIGGTSSYEPSTTTSADIDRMISGDSYEPESNLLGKVSSAASAANKWIGENKKLSEVIAGAVGSAYNASEARKKSAEQLKAEEDKRNRVNASILGMKATKKPSGLIPSLKRNNGSAVFDDKGRFAK